MSTPDSGPGGTPPVTITKQLLESFWKGAALPAALLIFYLIAPQWLDTQIHSAITENIRKSTRHTEAEKTRQIAAFNQVRFRDVVRSDDPKLQQLRHSLEEDGISGQFARLEWGRILSAVLVFVVLGTNAATLLLNHRARRSRDALIAAYRLAWKVAIAAALVQLALMIPLLAYGTFELTTLAIERYYPQLIAAFVIGGVIALWRSATILLRTPPLEFEEKLAREVTPDEAPALWQVVRDAAARLNTAPPDHILIGMKLNFYVTEFAVVHSNGRTEGRTLFLSQPLLKQLAPDEVVAIIGHELGHFMGEDTKLTRDFHPLRWKAQGTHLAIAASGWVGWTSTHVMNFFHWAFGGTEQAFSRVRELAADAVAAALTDAATAGRALVKIHVVTEAYGQGIAGEPGKRLDDLWNAPLVPYIREHLAPRSDFWTKLFEATTPHPLDSHPPLHVRLASLQQSIRPDDAIVIATTEVPTAYAAWFEGRDALFASINEKAAAELSKIRAGADVARADAATDAGRELLETHFPERRFAVRSFPVWLMIVGCGLIGGLLILAGIFFADPVGTSVLCGIGAVILLLAYAGCRRYWRGELIVRADRLQCTGWDRPLEFSEVATIHAVRTNGSITIKFRYKHRMPPLWEAALPYRRKTETLTLSWWSAKQDDLWRTIFRYYHRQLENEPGN